MSALEEYLIYLRKSRKDRELELQTGDYDTLERHRRTLLDLAKRRGYLIAHIYEEVVSGDTIADLTEALAAEQKARVTYDNILRLSDDPDVNDVIKFLRAREIVHFQRFGEGLRLAKEKMDQKNLYFVNPSFDQ